MRNKVKRAVCRVLAAVLALGVFTGCGMDAGGTQQEQAQEKESDGAKGRYLESDVDFPENTDRVYDMVKLEDGTIRIAAEDSNGQKAVWNLQEDGSTWEKGYDLPAEEISRMALSPAGGAFVVYTEISEPGGMEEERYYELDASGVTREVPVQSEEYVYFMRYIQEGELLMKQQNRLIGSIQMDTGEITEKFSGTEDVSFFGTAGNTVYMVSNEGEIFPYDGKTGEALAKDEGLSEAVSQSGAHTDVRSLECMPLVFAGGTGEDEVFFCSDKGLYRYMKNGSIAELVVDGTLTSIGNPSTGLISLAAADNNEFYLLTVEADSDYQFHLFRYVYSKDAAAVPESRLRVWSLHENTELQQNISQYQKQNQEAYVSLEVGVTEDNGVTDSDALKNLSTEIMAGKGPDLLVLDGLPVDAYMEKGMLEDVTDTANQAQGLFSNLMHGVEQDGKIYGIPLRFGMPLVAGGREVLENIQDLQSFADAVEELKGRKEPQRSVYNSFYNGTYLAAQIYDSCSPVWLNENGTLAEDLLEEFYTQLNRIYDTDNCAEDYAEFYNGISERGVYSDFVSSVGGGIMELYNDRTMLNFGDILSVTDLAMIHTTIVEKEGISYKPLAGQSARVYVPKFIMGINSQSGAKEAAKEFLAFLLTEEAQKASMGMGLPVHEKALESMAEGVEESIFGTSMSNDPDSYMEMHVKKLDLKTIEEFTGYIKEADTPAVTNEILRNAVLEQADDCVQGNLTPAEAVKQVSEKIRLYLAE